MPMAATNRGEQVTISNSQPITHSISLLLYVIFYCIFVFVFRANKMMMMMMMISEMVQDSDIVTMEC